MGEQSTRNAPEWKTRNRLECALRVVGLCLIVTLYVGWASAAFLSELIGAAHWCNTLKPDVSEPLPDLEPERAP